MATDEPMNPYQPPEAPVGEILPDADPETIRQAYSYREAAIRATGRICYLVAAAFQVLAIIAALLMREQEREGGGSRLRPYQILIVFSITETLFVAFASMASGLSRLRPWGRWLGLIASGSSVALYLAVSGFGLWRRRPHAFEVVGIGALTYALPALLFILLVSGRGRVVFSPSYREVVGMTPHLRARLDIRSRAFFGLIGGTLALLVVALIAVIIWDHAL